MQFISMLKFLIMLWNVPIDDDVIILFAVTTAYCENENWIGDGYCDDVTNNEECQWDGGDCCGNNVNTQYCQVCACLDPGAGAAGSGTTMPSGSTMPTTTHKPFEPCK